MATKKEIEKHLKQALQEVGSIEPWYDDQARGWVFESADYPVSYCGKSPEEVISNYPMYLRDFIQERLNNNLDSLVEQSTKGRGGARPGAGRPKGIRGEPTKQIRLPIDIVEWLRQPGIIQHLRQVMGAYHTSHHGLYACEEDDDR